MRRLLPIFAAIDALNRRIGRAVAWLTLAMVLVGAGTAVSRYAFRSVSNATIELQWHLFSVVFLLGAAYTLRTNSHVRVDVFYGRLSARKRAWIDLVGGVVLLVPFCAIGLWSGWRTFQLSWETREGSPDPGGLLVYPIKAVIPLAFLLLLLQGLSEIHKRLLVVCGADPDEVGLEESFGDEPSADPEGNAA